MNSLAFIQSDWNLEACLYGFKLLKSRVVVLFVAGTYRVFLICFGVHYWYFGQCISYAVVASVLLGAAVSRHLLVIDPLAAIRDALQSTVIRLREGFRGKDQNSSASSSEGCGSSVKRSSSADAGHLGNAIVPCTSDGSTGNNIEGINSDKSIDSGRPSLALRSSSCRSVVQEPEVGSSYVDRNLEHYSSLVVCSNSGLESQGGDSSTSTSTNQQILDLNLALAFQEKLSDPRITSMLKRKGRHTDRELANLFPDKGLDPNIAVMLEKNGLDPMILTFLQRRSLDADREHCDSNPPVTDSNDVEDVLPNHISFLEELRLQGLGKWLQRFRFEFRIAVLLLSPIVCSILAFQRSLQAEDLSMTSKPRKYGFIAWMLSTCVGLPLSFLRGSGKKNFTDLSKSPHGHSKKVHPKKSGRDSSRKDLSVPVLIWTIRRLKKETAELDSRTRRLETENNELQSVLEKELDRRSSDWSLKLEKYQIEQHRLCESARELVEQNVSLQREVFLFNEKEVDNRIKMSFSKKHLKDLSKRIEQVSEKNQNLRQQLTQLQIEYRVPQDNRDYVRENYQEKVKELKSETLLTTVLREKLYSEEMDIKQLQAGLDATVRGNYILKCEVQNMMDALSYDTPKLKYLELQVLKKDKNINQLTNDLQECKKELGVVKAILPKVFQERDFMWEEVKSYSEINMLLNYEINMLKRKVDTLDEDFLMKKVQITILKDSIGKPFDLLASPDSLLE
ncbi:Calpain-type cysteine protease DEK1 [Capsicum baccatum]|uniref:Calpain-type cysteine protease DEK1 n=1 Tax=Capsicum baccatum TaxID=33114 RepID=A0A2G2V8F4_CAPBA|nr:Calpain-type cysteine protease DEK1 [Capsicum baccatum]